MLELIIIVFIALELDLLIGDPRNKYHPTALLGTFIYKLVQIAKKINKEEKFLGFVLVTVTLIPILFLLTIFMNFSDGIFVYCKKNCFILYSILIMLTSILLKMTISINGMEKHAILIINEIDNDNIIEARKKLSMIVNRDTSQLDKNHVMSGILESMSENIVDGITGPLFYFSIFGIFGALIYRVINTIDSMIGHKNNFFKNLGWFGAHCDTILNYLPSRLTGFTIIICSMLFGYDWKNSYKIMKQFHDKTISCNSGYPISALAGALKTKFEKIGYYTIGEETTNITTKHVVSSIKMMKFVSVMFCIIFIIPIVILLSYFG